MPPERRSGEAFVKYQPLPWWRLYNVYRGVCALQLFAKGICFISFPRTAVPKACGASRSRVRVDKFPGRRLVLGIKRKQK